MDAESIIELKKIYFQIHKKLTDFRKNEDYISDKLYKLYQKIDELFIINNKSKFIVFINNRIVATFLKPALNTYLREKYKNKKCNEVIIINKKKSEENITIIPSLTPNQLNEIISKFNENKFDILITTNAIEEGPDILSCNAVLALIELKIPKSYIRIKNIARKSNSYIYIFTNSANETKTNIKNFIKIDEKMKELFGVNIVKDFRKKEYISERPSFLFDFDINTHSKITMGNSTMIFNEVRQQIESMNIKFIPKINIIDVKSKNKSQEYEYIGEIIIDTDLKDFQEEFPFSTKPQNLKDNATRLCHFYALSKLKKYQFLDSHLKFCKNKA